MHDFVLYVDGIIRPDWGETFTPREARREFGDDVVSEDIRGEISFLTIPSKKVISIRAQSPGVKVKYHDLMPRFLPCPPDETLKLPRHIMFCCITNAAQTQHLFIRRIKSDQISVTA